VSARPARRGLFVTGTDTGVGKTTIAMALLRQARRLGMAPVPFKPAETGCDPDAADARALWQAAGSRVDEADVCLYRLRLPAAPAQAAAAEGLRIDVDRIVARSEALAARGDFLLVEGAGGLLVPYTDTVTAADLAARLGLPLLVVARTALGTVNHTALTLREAARAGLTTAGLILNRTVAAAAPHEDGNAELIAGLTGVRPLGTFPWLPPATAGDPDAAADALGASLSDGALRALLGSSG
jgi:dethiobiotin synthetase